MLVEAVAVAVIDNGREFFLPVLFENNSGAEEYMNKNMPEFDWTNYEVTLAEYNNFDDLKTYWINYVRDLNIQHKLLH